METGFWIFMLVMDFLLPLIMVVFGKLFQHCPEEINSVFGYRTRRSMAYAFPIMLLKGEDVEIQPPRLRQTLVPLGSGAAAGDGGADAPGVGAGHRHRGPLRRRGDGGAAGGAAAVCGGGGKRVEADLW
mgnify:CR=1 FL=1